MDLAYPIVCFIAILLCVLVAFVFRHQIRKHELGSFRVFGTADKS